jgi:ParB family chromosome partitioning protein
MRHDRHFVDELAQRMGEGIGRMVRITAITSNQDQPRSSLGALEDLQSSIDKHGVLEPLLVRRLDDGRYELVSGERRFHAAMAVGLTEVPCIELEVSDQLALEIALIENLQRKDLTAFEEADGYRTLIDKYDYTHEEVGQAVGRSRVTVTESLRLLAIPESIRDLCRHADITAKGVLLEIDEVNGWVHSIERVRVPVETPDRGARDE